MPSVLIVEDDPTLLTAVSDNFRSRGFEVHVATEGKQALTLGLAGGFDVILLDVMLPAVNGFEICRTIRSKGDTTPIIMLTARDREDDVIRGLELGADDYMTKPFSIRELVARVRSLQRRLGRGQDSFLFGDFRLELAGRTLHRGETMITLTGKEFDLLEMFVSRPNRAVTRREILNRVWGHSVIVSGRSVDRCVTTLRSKIETDPKQPAWIQTVRNIGYRFCQ